jgi:hypothetical protein
LLLADLDGNTYSGDLSPADLAEAVSDGLGLHEHDGWPAHPHGAPSFSDEEVAYLAERGCHIDRFHGEVFGIRLRLSPLTVANMLRKGRAEGKLR